MSVSHDTDDFEFGTVERSGMSPRQRRKVSQLIQYAVLVIAAVALAVSADWPRVTEQFLKLELTSEMLPELVTVALVNTVIYTVSGYALGFALGLVLALMRLSSVTVNRGIALVYVEIFRGLPALLIFLIIGFGVPVAFPAFSTMVGEYGAVALGLGLVSAAYLAETFRAGIQAVPKGQVEAARSLGMSSTKTTITVVLPQAMRIIIPPLTNEMILLFKDSSLVYVMGISGATIELAQFASDSATDFSNSTPLVVGGLMYLVITLPLGYAVRRLERKQAKAG